MVASTTSHLCLKIHDPAVGGEPAQEIMGLHSGNMTTLGAADAEHVRRFQVGQADLELETELARLVRHAWEHTANKSVRQPTPEWSP